MLFVFAFPSSSSPSALRCPLLASPSAECLARTLRPLLQPLVHLKDGEKEEGRGGKGPLWQPPIAVCYGLFLFLYCGVHCVLFRWAFGYCGVQCGHSAPCRGKGTKIESMLFCA